MLQHSLCASEITSFSKQVHNPLAPKRTNAIYKLTNHKQTKPAPRGQVLSWRYGEQGTDEVATADLVGVGLMRTRKPNAVTMTVKAIT